VIDTRTALDRESQRFELRPDAFERLLRRRDRKERSRRVSAAVLAIVVTVLSIAGLMRAFNNSERPATEPTPTPVDTGNLGGLAYVLDGDIYVADGDGKNPIRIADGVGGPTCSGYWAEGPIWSPDGRYLAYRGSAGDGDLCHPIVEIRDPEGRLVASFPGEGWLTSWSPDSTRVATFVDWGRTIGVYGLDGARQSLLNLPPGLMAPGDFDPVWAPDGASLLVPLGVEVPLDGRTPRQLPRDDPRSQWGVTFSLDGSWAAYLRSGSLFVAAADGSQARILIPARVEDAAISPAGDQVAFAYRTFGERKGLGPATELRVVDVSSGTVTRLAGMDGQDYFGVIEFSPEGDQILYSRTNADGESSLWSVRLDGSDPHLLVVGTVWGDWQTLSATR
jgi:Tol biopolymer transport system component